MVIPEVESAPQSTTSIENFDYFHVLATRSHMLKYGKYKTQSAVNQVGHFKNQCET